MVMATVGRRRRTEERAKDIGEGFDRAPLWKALRAWKKGAGGISPRRPKSYAAINSRRRSFLAYSNQVCCRCPSISSGAITEIEQANDDAPPRPARSRRVDQRTEQT